MSDAWRSSKIQEFEQVLAGPTTALLRVAAKPSRRRSSTEGRPVLVADDGRRVHRFAPIPSPPDGRGILRAAYSVPIELIQPETSFSLELGDGRSTALPAPTPGAARLLAADSADGGSEPAPDAGGPGDSDGVERRADPIDQLAELSAALAEAQQAGVESAEAQTAAEAKAASAQEELTTLRARVESLESEAHPAQETSESQVAEVQLQATRAQELNDSLERRNVQLDESTREYQDRIGALERELEVAVASRAELETGTDELRSARLHSQQELDRASDAARIMTSERDELARQAAAFDDVATKARDRAAQAEAANERSEATLAELQIWRGELERRLAAATTELAAVKTGRQEDERQLDQLRAALADAAEEAAAQVAAAQAEAVRAASERDTQASDRIRALESERQQIAGQVRELVSLLESSERLGELASELAQARERAESLEASTSLPEPPPPDAEAPAGPPTAPAQRGGDAAELAETQAEIQTLRAKLERAHAASESDQLELIRLSAEADARLQAERELTRAAERRSER